MMRFHIGSTLFLAVAVVIGTPETSQAQQVTEDAVFSFEQCVSLFAARAADQSVQKRESRLPLGVSEVAPAATTAVALVASEKDGRGLISFSKNIQSSGGMADDWALTISTPFNKSENQAVPVSLAGLSGDIVASGSFSRFIWNIHPQEYGRALCTACKDASILTLTECNQQDLKKKLAGVRTTAEIDRQINLLQDALFGTSVGRVWGLETSVGRRERTFFEIDADKESEDRVGYSFAAVAGRVLKWGSVYGRLTGKRD